MTFAGSPSLLSAQQLQGNYEHPQLPDEDWAEYVVPVTWLETRPRDQALWVKGMFANQNSACKLRNAFTLEQLARSFKLDVEPETSQS